MNLIPMLSRRALDLFMTESHENQVDAENRFILNLTRMAGTNTNAVTPDCILEFLAHVQNKGLDELQFIEEAYTSIIFEDEPFMSTYLHICSVEVLIDRYETAKKENNSNFLEAFRVLHRQARVAVLDESTKTTLREFIKRRRASNELKLVGNIVSNIVEYLTRFGTPSMSDVMRRFLPLITAENNIQAIQNNLTSGIVNSGRNIPSISDSETKA